MPKQLSWAGRTDLFDEARDALTGCLRHADLTDALTKRAAAEDARKAQIIEDGIVAGAYLYKRLRWIAALLFGALSDGTLLNRTQRP